MREETESVLELEPHLRALSPQFGFTHDAAGNIATNDRGGMIYAYAYKPCQ